MSASSKTIKGAFPPSSIDIFLSVDEDCCIKILPTRVDPVKDTLWTCATRVSNVGSKEWDGTNEGVTAELVSDFRDVLVGYNNVDDSRWDTGLTSELGDGEYRVGSLGGSLELEKGDCQSGISRGEV